LDDGLSLAAHSDHFLRAVIKFIKIEFSCRKESFFLAKNCFYDQNSPEPQVLHRNRRSAAAAYTASSAPVFALSKWLVAGFEVSERKFAAIVLSMDGMLKIELIFADYYTD
jgi:hypothetical protein